MPDLLLASVEYTGYISIIKFLAFLVLFFLWLPIVRWVYNDAEAIGANAASWTAVVLAAGGVAATIWLLIPVFLIGLLFYILAVGATSISYVIHRNARVMDFDRVLTAEHIKGLFASKENKLDALKDFLFITANNNDVPLPEPKTVDFFGYKGAYEILRDSQWRRASSIVFSPAPESYDVTYYVDGAALKQPSIARSQMEYSIQFLKNLADLNADEKRKPQKGRFGVRQGNTTTNWEVATAGSTAGEQVRLKQIIEQSVTRLNDIGLMPEQYELLNKMRGVKEGLFIVAGPKKSGVTTTFYALLKNHDAFLNSINTLEKQPSARLPNITQNVFKPTDTGTTTYADKLQTVVRMGPDVVGVADCTDSETAQVVCDAAKDGKVLYITLEADNVLQALGRWLKLVGDRNLAVAPLIGISNQRLMRKLCEECKQAYGPNPELLKKFNLPAEKAKVLYRAGKLQYPKHGKPITCENCQGTGFVGRTGVFESIIINEDLKKTIKKAKSLPEIGHQFRRAKMLYLQEQAMRKIIAGTTAVNEMIKVFSATKKRKPKNTKQNS